MTTQQLKPCPFCGNNNLRISPAYYDLGENNTGELFYFVYCDNCDATGGEHGSKNEAVMHWNTRITHSLKILPEHLFYDDEYVIAHNQTTMESIIININKSLAFSVDAVSDDTLVEVINETTSN